MPQETITIPREWLEELIKLKKEFCYNPNIDNELALGEYIESAKALLNK